MKNSSLREFDSVADRVRQHRQVSRSPILIVEGPSDMIVLESHLGSVDFFPAGSRNEVLVALQKMIEWSISEVLGLIDQDFGVDERENAVSSRLVRYDGADLEAMLIDMGALRHVILHLSSAQKRELADIDAIVATILSEARWVGMLRSENARQCWGARFVDISVAGKCNRTTLRIDRARYCSALCGACDGEHRVPIYALAEEVPDADGPYRGKDAAAIAGVALRSKLGSLSHSEASEESISAAIRMSAAAFLEGSIWLASLRGRFAELS